MTTTTEELLAERGTTHGEYTDHARITQAIKTMIYGDEAVDPEKFTDIMRESIDMIAHKLGRIAAGDPRHKDHWDDIAGYAKLVSQRL
jgi:Domain of unknown function (DUF6378)